MQNAFRRPILSLVALSLLLFIPIAAFAQIPFVNQPLVPDAKAPGAGAFTLTVNGTGFVSGSEVHWNGSPRSTTFVSASQLKAAIPAADIATRGTATVTVLNPGSRGGLSNTAFFSVVSATGHSGAFVLASSPPTGDCPNSVATGDFNGDGNLDLALTNDCGNTISIMLGDGAGNFVLSSLPAVGNQSGFIVVGDFNRDGKLDLALANYDRTVTVALGDGVGNFTLATSVTVDSGAGALAVADFNEDGKLDLAVTGGGAFSVLLGDGTGHFTLASSLATNWPAAVAVGDFNGDGRLDVAVTNSMDDTVSIYRGDGTAHFTFFSSAPTGGYPSSVAVGDLNGDGKLDLAISNYTNLNNNTVSILLGDGSGNFALASSPAPGINPNPVVLGDFNADGKLDLAVANIRWDTMYTGISTLVGDGAGTFSLTSFSPANFDIQYANRFAVGDFNKDGRLDLAVADERSNSVSILLNQGRQKQPTTTLTATPNPSAFWQPVTLSAAVDSGSEKPAGLVVFWDAPTMLGTATLTDESASIAIPLLAGSHAITAEYQGSVEYSAKVSAPVHQIVNRASTTTSLVSSPNPAFAKQTVTYTATVTTQNGGDVTGSVAFQDGGVTIGTVPLSPYQPTSFDTSYATAGTHQITAKYLGDNNNASSVSGSLIETIWNPAISSKTSVVPSKNPSYVGQTVTFTATVTASSGSIPNGESVTFFDGWTPLASVALTHGTASYTTASLSPKPRFIRVSYPGDATFKPSSGYEKQLVLRYPTKAVLTASPEPSKYYQPVTFTAAITTSGPCAVTGWVRFWDGTTAMNTMPVRAGVATLTTSKLAIGTHVITAKYLSDSCNAASSSNAVSHVVQ